MTTALAALEDAILAGQTIEVMLSNGQTALLTAVTAGGGAGITQLTGDVEAGPGAGVQSALVAQVSGAPAGTLVPVTTELRLEAGANPTPILSFFTPPSGLSTFGIIRWPQGGGVAGAGTATGLYARNIANTGNVQVLTYDGGGNVSMGADGSIDGGIALDCNAEVSIGANTTHTVLIDASAGTADVNIGTGNANVVTIGHNGMVGGVLLPDLVSGGGGVMQADPATGLVGTTAFRLDVLDSGTAVAIAAGGTVNGAGLAVAAGNSNLEVVATCTDLASGETMGPGLTGPTVGWAIFNNAGTYEVQFVNHSGGTRHVNYRVIQYN